MSNDNQKLFEHYFNTRIITDNFELGFKYAINKHGIELIVRPECDQKCEYCYIHNYGKSLYPKHLTKDEILHNIDLLFDYLYVQKKNYFFSLELFGGDLFSDGLIFDIYDLIIKYFEIIKKEEPSLFRYRKTHIMMPSNLSFVRKSEEQVKKYEEYKRLFYDKFNVELRISWSTDGLYCEDTRENKGLTQEDFDKVFKFVKEQNGGLHPMISACNIDKWVDNYDWWVEMFKKHNLDDCGQFQPMMLEVRNNDWTDDKIESYVKLLDHVLNVRLKLCGGSVEELAKHLFSNEPCAIAHCNDYDILTIPSPREDGARNEDLTCSLQSRLHFDVSQLTLVPCHRLAYRQYVGGRFTVDEANEHITGIQEHNMTFYVAAKNTKLENHPICSNCKLGKLCLRGCLGSQYENSAEPFFPCDTVCKLFKTKFTYLAQKYKEMGLIDIAVKNKYLHPETNLYKTLIDLVENKDEYAQ